MKASPAWFVIAELLCLLTTRAQAAEPLAIDSLTCEHKTNPLGLDAAAPRLSWKLVTTTQNVKQTAYQIEAWSDRGRLWDSGKIPSSDSVFVPYQGKRLRSRERVSWTVQVWDNQHRQAKSSVATWEMGLLSKADWRGAWIANGTSTGTPALPVQKKGLFWIAYPEGNPAVSAPSATRWLRRKFILPSGARVSQAHIGVAADAEAQISLNGYAIGRSPGHYRLYPFDIRAALRAGENELLMVVNNGGDAGGVAAQLQVQLEGHPPRILSTDKQWQAHKGDNQWVAAMEAAPAGQGAFWKGSSLDVMDFFEPRPAPQFRSTFVVKGTIQAARLYATALGLYEVELNGRKVGQDLLAPGWTDYNKRVQYQTHDVTRFLSTGKNAIGAYVADGWYAGKIGYAGRSVYGTQARLLLNLVIETTDGRRQYVNTGTGWKVAPGPIRAADLQDGETFDATEQNAGWSTPDFDDKNWVAPVVIPRSQRDPSLVAEPGLPVSAFEDRGALSVSEPTAGVYVFDFGQNLAGFVRLAAKAPRGTQIRLRFAEVLNTDGTLYTENLRTAKNTDRYTFAGVSSGETWQPRFSMHGFRYVELSGWSGQGMPDRDVLTAVVVHSGMPVSGRLASSSELVNQLVANIDWGQRGNFLSVPTDCPQRDERLGWLGDAQIFARTAARNRDVLPFFSKWLHDVRDAQSQAGAFSDVAPRAPATGELTPAWGDAGVIVPWVLYEEYGDVHVLRQHYSAMKRWVDLVHKNNPNFLWVAERGNNFGDWLSVNAQTDKGVLATAFFAQSATLLARTAQVLNLAADARHYDALAKNIRKAFVNAYISSDGSMKRSTQTAFVLALRFDLVPQDLRHKVLAHLVNDIAQRQYHLTTGFIGVGHLLPVLSRFGRDDVAYRLLMNDTFPSWGYSIKHGATTIWERWDGYTADKGFATPNMNSFNHYSLGSVGEWLYDTVLGIAPAQPGYKEIRVAPHPGGGLTYAHGGIETPYGKVQSAWSCDERGFHLQVVVPPNTQSVVVVPGTVTAIPAGVSREKDPSTFNMGSGAYAFDSTFVCPVL